MLSRSMGKTGSPSKNQDLSITFMGKTYAICSEDQMEYIKIKYRDQIAFEAYEAKLQLTEEELKNKLNDVIDNCGFATLAMVLDKMTPDQRKEWEAKYRFTPVTRFQK